TSPRHATRSARRTSKPRASGRGAKPLLVAGAIVTVVVVAALVIPPLARPQHTQPPSVLIQGGGTITPGGTVLIHGSNFTAGGSVSLTVDGHPATLAGSASNPQAAHSGDAFASLSLLAYSSISSSATTVRVKSDG